MAFEDWLTQRIRAITGGLGAVGAGGGSELTGFDRSGRDHLIAALILAQRANAAAGPALGGGRGIVERANTPFVSYEDGSFGPPERIPPDANLTPRTGWQEGFRGRIPPGMPIRPTVPEPDYTPVMRDRLLAELGNGPNPHLIAALEWLAKGPRSIA